MALHVQLVIYASAQSKEFLKHWPGLSIYLSFCNQAPKLLPLPATLCYFSATLLSSGREQLWVSVKRILESRTGFKSSCPTFWHRHVSYPTHLIQFPELLWGWCVKTWQTSTGQLSASDFIIYTWCSRWLSLMDSERPVSFAPLTQDGGTSCSGMKCIFLVTSKRYYWYNAKVFLKYTTEINC